MMMLADKRTALYLLAGEPADPSAPTVADFEDAINVADKVAAADTYLRPTGSEQVKDPLLSGGAQNAFGSSNYEGSINVVRFLDETGVPDDTEDMLYTAVKEKGTTLWFALREGPVWNTTPAAKQEVSVFQVITDDPQSPQTREGYIKRRVPLAVAEAWLDRSLAA